MIKYQNLHLVNSKYDMFLFAMACTIKSFLIVIYDRNDSTIVEPLL